VRMIRRLSTDRAAHVARTFTPDAWWRPVLQSARGVVFEAAFTRQQAWMETPRLERQYLSADRAFALARSEPVAPAEYTDGTIQWLGALGKLVECPTCTGNGRTTCKTCNGQQRIACPRCAHLPDHRPPCAGCNGLRFVGTAPCPKCEGKGFEATCLKCDGKRSVDCPRCIGMGNTSCEKCDGNSKVYEVDVASKKFETSSSVTWQERPSLPNHVVAVLEERLPLVKEETLDKPEQAEVAVIGLRRMQHTGTVELVRFTRLLATTVIVCGGRIVAVPRGVAKALPSEWFQG
jgi:hypothetical protein